MNRSVGSSAYEARLFPSKLMYRFDTRVESQNGLSVDLGDSKNRESGLDQISRFLECLSNAVRTMAFTALTKSRRELIAQASSKRTAS
jgi:hypothetical protein